MKLQTLTQEDRVGPGMLHSDEVQVMPTAHTQVPYDLRVPPFTMSCCAFL